MADGCWSIVCRVRRFPSSVDVSGHCVSSRVRPARRFPSCCRRFRHYVSSHDRKLTLTNIFKPFLACFVGDSRRYWHRLNGDWPGSGFLICHTVRTYFTIVRTHVMARNVHRWRKASSASVDQQRSAIYEYVTWMTVYTSDGNIFLSSASTAPLGKGGTNTTLVNTREMQ